ncbi:hypothetical protein DPX16_17839 [Anabarilius grahami]|uniref:Zinc finger protein 862 n=1 Tax=Anabarilius grahami TaxID=495550 RepID=A0A3N0YD86_ANAGA|nr:hypothetical protein DPX16_17839 [Anabarilius grahami]
MVAKRVADNPSSGPLNLMARRMNEENYKRNERLVNAAYHIIKNEQPFVSFERSIDLVWDLITTQMLHVGALQKADLLDWKERLVGFGSDGAAVMVGKHGGVAKLLRQDVPHLINIHCLGHGLELAALDTINAHEKMKRRRFKCVESEKVLQAACCILDPREWPKDAEALASYGREELLLLTNHFAQVLDRMGCDRDTA